MHSRNTAFTEQQHFITKFMNAISSMSLSTSNASYVYFLCPISSNVSNTISYKKILVKLIHMSLFLHFFLFNQYLIFKVALPPYILLYSLPYQNHEARQFPNLSASNHGTLNPSNLAMSQSYLGSQKLIRGNSFTFYIFKLGSNTFESPFA